MLRLLGATLALCTLCLPPWRALAAAPMTEPLRVATYNTSLYDPEGQLRPRLRAGDTQAAQIAAVIQRLRPDLLLLNEFDYDPEHEAVELFQRRYLEVAQEGQAPIHYPHRFLAAVNTGVPSGLDINGDGKVELPNDAWGYGHKPGQYGMLVLSRYPIDHAAARTFQHLRWSQLPQARRPTHADGRPFHPDAVWTQLRLSSKSHWDVPIDTPHGRVHFLVSHPTPPVFDGPEQLNKRRNFDELRLWVEYLGDGAADWLVDDGGRAGRLDGPGQPASMFVIAGDLNADPADGVNLAGAIDQLLTHPRVLDYPPPRSEAAAKARRAGSLGTHRGNPALDTAQFSEHSGNLRVDYLLPSRHWRVQASGVFWPQAPDPAAGWIEASDHRPVWLELWPLSPAADPD